MFIFKYKYFKSEMQRNGERPANPLCWLPAQCPLRWTRTQPPEPPLLPCRLCVSWKLAFRGTAKADMEALHGGMSASLPRA